MKKVFLISAILISAVVSAQTNFSLATGVSGLRNFSPQQKFWAIGQTVQMNFHFSPRQGAYASLDYFTEGKYKNNFTAIAKNPTISPQQINYTATGRILYRQVSLGWKHYFKGSYNQEKELNIYGTAGFGYLFSKLRNHNSIVIDSALYAVHPKDGEGKLDRLTFDLSIAGEMPLGGNFFAFAQLGTWLPASSTESPYLHQQRNIPLPLTAAAGLRILFGFDY